MKKNSVYEISEAELLKMLGNAIGRTVNTEHIVWILKQTGDYDKGTFRRWVAGVSITMPEETTDQVTDDKEG